MVLGGRCLISVGVASAVVWNENQLEALNRRILAKDADGNVIETPEEMFERVARHLADDDGEYFDFLDVMSTLKFLPNSPALVNAGRPLAQLAACFVLPVGDSIQEWGDTNTLTMRIHQSGGGTGFDFSEVREQGARVSTSGNVASGPLSPMRIINTSTEQIKQGGVRRGANMAILRVDHPDIMSFIRAKMPKEDGSRDLTNFNISVAITDDFVDALKNDGTYTLRSPLGYEAGQLDAREVWNAIAESAWTTGDPGLFFVDRVNRLSPVPNLGQIAATNPCGEVPLLPWETCNLGSLALPRFVTSSGGTNWPELERVVRVAVRFLNRVIDKNQYPHPEVERVTKMSRKIGLGVMGFADYLIMKGIKYDSEEALDEARRLGRFINNIAHDESVLEAFRYGNFPAIEGSKWGTRRNSTVTVIAPTGTISIIADCSSGIEPLFAISFTKNVMDTTLTVTHPLYNEDTKHLFRTADVIAPEWHVRMQAAWQENVEDAVSKTINMPNSATVAEVQAAYDLGVSLGVKGLTIFRDGCLDAQVLDRACPDCGTVLIRKEGCEECPNCGLSMCST